MRLPHHALLLLIVVWIAGCGSGTAGSAGTAQSPSPSTAPATASVPASVPASGAETLASARTRLDQMLASAAHCTADAECRSVATGGKACGGPTGYAAYSTRLADSAAVEALAKQESELEFQAERDAHRVSNCLFMGDPGAHCEKQRCETGTMGATRPGSPATR
jgi:hypothetical protein